MSLMPSTTHPNFDRTAVNLYGWDTELVMIEQGIEDAFQDLLGSVHMVHVHNKILKVARSRAGSSPATPLQQGNVPTWREISSLRVSEFRSKPLPGGPGALLALRHRPRWSLVERSISNPEGMVAKLQVYDNGGRRWALHKCEDYLVVDAYLRIRKHVPNSDKNFINFEHHYFDRGDMLSDRDLITINHVLRRKGYDQIAFVDGHSDSHSLMRGNDKVRERIQIRESLETMLKDKRDLVMNKQREEARALHSRDLVYDTEKQARLVPLEDRGMTRVARTKLTEQLTSAVENGTVVYRHVEPIIHAPCPSSAALKSVEPEKIEQSDHSKAEDEPVGVVATAVEDDAGYEPSMDDIEEAMYFKTAAKKAGVGRVRLAMLTETQEALAALRQKVEVFHGVAVAKADLDGAMERVHDTFESLSGRLGDIQRQVEDDRAEMLELRKTVGKLKRMLMDFAAVEAG